jgi:hypothetical protein
MSQKSKNTKIRIRQLPIAKRTGLLKTETGRTLQSHEITAVNKLLKFGYDIFCRVEANLPYVKVADIVWQNEQWEIKSISGNSRHTVRNNLRKARKQSVNIVLDTTNSKIRINSAINRAKDMMRRNKQIKKILILDRENYCIIDRSVI